MTVQQDTSTTFDALLLNGDTLVEERQDHWQGRTSELEKNWQSAEGSYLQAVTPSRAVRHEDIEDELLFCLLGGYGIAEEHGRSAWLTVRQLEPFSEIWKDDDLLQKIMDILELPQFEPRRVQMAHSGDIGSQNGKQPSLWRHAGGSAATSPLKSACFIGMTPRTGEGYFWDVQGWDSRVQAGYCVTWVWETNWPSWMFI